MSNNEAGNDPNKIIELSLFQYSLNEKEKTATLVKNKMNNGNVMIPRSINYESQEYIITSLGKGSFRHSHIESIQFAPDSELSTIETETFDHSEIERITFLSSLKELKEKWCFNTSKLNEISIMPDNKFFTVYKNTFILGKSFPEKENFDILVFCVRNIKIAIIPNFIEIIGPNSFEGCKNLESVQFEANSKLRIIDNCAFSNCSISSISLPPNLEEIKEQSFSFCTKLISIHASIDSKLKSIGNYAFLNSRIEFISIPPSFREFNERWCEAASCLRDIDVMPGNPYFTRYEDKFILRKSSLEKENFDILVFCIQNCENVVIPNFIEIIGPLSFKNCKNIKKVDFSSDSKLNSIEKYAFCACQLETFTIPSTLTKIGECAFDTNINLRHFVIPDDSKLEIIEKFAFKSTSIENFFIPPHLLQINDYAFYCCRKLQHITCSENSKFQAISKCAFGRSSIQSLTLPSSLVKLEAEWCNATDQLIDINISPNNPNFTLYDNALILRKSNPVKESFDVLVFCFRNVERVVIPSFIEVIEPCAFYSCKKLQQVEFYEDSKLRTIGKSAFYDSSIEQIIIPAHVTTIEESAFCQCQKLQTVEFKQDSELRVIEKFAFKSSSIEKIIIPQHVKKICAESFSFCHYLQCVEFQEDSELQIIENDVFNQSAIERFTLHSNVEKLDKSWCNGTSQLYEIDVKPNNRNFILHDDFLILGKSTPQNEIFNVLLFCFRSIEILTYTPQFVEIIAPYAFCNCLYLQNVDLSINSNIQIIDDYAFKRSSIERISVPKSLTTIGRFSFSECKNLRQVSFPPNSELQKIDEYAFEETSIETFTIPNSLKHIYQYAFSRCSRLQYVNINYNSNLQIIEDGAFYRSSIRCFYVPAKVQYIGCGAFAFCNKLSIIEIDENSELKYFSAIILQNSEAIIMAPFEIIRKIFH